MEPVKKPAEIRPGMALGRIRLDTDTLNRERLNIESKTRSNLFPWNGQFSPQLVHAFLETYARPGNLVLDPFMGSGTVLVEAGRLGLPAFGAEINPAAYTMAGVYSFITMEHSKRKRVLDKLDLTLREKFASWPLFARCDDRADPKTSLIGLWSATPNALHRRLLETLIVLLDFYRVDITAEKVSATWSKLRSIVVELPYSREAIGLANVDARSLPLEASTVDLVITSPPYINVFNYHQQYRASVEAMGWDLLHVARSEVGSNRKYRQNRFFTVVQYCIDMAAVLRELLRVGRESSRIIIVVGRESNVLKTPFYNGDIVASIGSRCVGLFAEKRQERAFKNRFGETIYEDIIHFRPSPSRNKNLEPPWVIAEENLTAALSYCPPESSASLQEALGRVLEVPTSPLYTPQIKPGLAS